MAKHEIYFMERQISGVPDGIMHKTETTQKIWFFKWKTPHEAMYTEKPKVSHLRVFGCTAYSHIPKDE